MRYGGARGQLTVRADSGFYAHTVVAACREMVSASLSPSASAPACGTCRGDTRGGLTPIPYWMDGAADVVETTYTPSDQAGRRAGAAHCRRVKPTPGSHSPSSPDTAITPSSPTARGDAGTGGRSAATPRSRTIRDLKYGVGLNHMPSGRFAANGRLAVQVMAHNLDQLDSPHRPGSADRDHQDPQAAGLRSGGTDHPARGAASLRSPPALALGNPVQSRLGPAARFQA